MKLFVRATPSCALRAVAGIVILSFVGVHQWRMHYSDYSGEGLITGKTAGAGIINTKIVRLRQLGLVVLLILR